MKKTNKRAKDFASVTITANVGCKTYTDYATGHNLDSGYWVNRSGRDEDKGQSTAYEWHNDDQDFYRSDDCGDY